MYKDTLNYTEHFDIFPTFKNAFFCLTYTNTKTEAKITKLRLLFKMFHLFLFSFSIMSKIFSMLKLS